MGMSTGKQSFECFLALASLSPIHTHTHTQWGGDGAAAIRGVFMQFEFSICLGSLGAASWENCLLVCFFFLAAADVLLREGISSPGTGKGGGGVGWGWLPV